MTVYLEVPGGGGSSSDYSAPPPPAGYWEDLIRQNEADFSPNVFAPSITQTLAEIDMQQVADVPKVSGRGGNSGLLGSLGLSSPTAVLLMIAAVVVAVVVLKRR